MGRPLYTLIIMLSVCCAAASWWLWEKANQRERFFLMYIMAIGFFELLAIVLSKLSSDGNNLPGLHLFTVVQFVLLTFFFSACLKELISWFRYQWVLFVGVIAIISNSIFFQSIFTYNSYSKTAVELYVIIMSIWLFVLFMRDQKHDHRRMAASVSFVSAVFLQSAASVIFYMYSNELLEMKKSLSVIIWNIKLGVNYIALFMILFGMGQMHAIQKSPRTQFDSKLIKG